MAAPPVCQITAAGMARPSFADCLGWVVSTYQAIYGADAALDVDTQDGQWLRSLADALHQSNGVSLAVFNAFAPSSAQGTNLSRLVALNGLRRKLASRSSVDLRIIGQANTTIVGGTAAGEDGALWLLPDTVTIPFAGEITVTAQAEDLGAVTAAANTITTIPNPVPGWQSVTNPEPATPGAPIETDPQLRARRAVATTKPSRTILEGMAAEIADLPGVTRVKAYENTGRVPDADGLPPGATAFVVKGGDVDAIAQAIGLNKANGSILAGTTQGRYTDGAGITRLLAFYRPHAVPLGFRVVLRKKAGYTADVAAAIRTALVNWVAARDYGERIVRSRTYLPAQLYGGPLSDTFELYAVYVARDGAYPGSGDIALAFDEEATCALADIDLDDTGGPS